MVKCFRQKAWQFSSQRKSEVPYQPEADMLNVSNRQRQMPRQAQPLVILQERVIDLTLSTLLAGVTRFDRCAGKARPPCRNSRRVLGLDNTRTSYSGSYPSDIVGSEVWRRPRTVALFLFFKVPLFTHLRGRRDQSRQPKSKRPLRHASTMYGSRPRYDVPLPYMFWRTAPAGHEGPIRCLRHSRRSAASRRELPDIVRNAAAVATTGTRPAVRSVLSSQDLFGPRLSARLPVSDQVVEAILRVGQGGGGGAPGTPGCGCRVNVMSHGARTPRQPGLDEAVRAGAARRLLAPHRLRVYSFRPI